MSIEFDYDGEVTAKDSEAVLDKVRDLRDRLLKAAATATLSEREQSLLMFAANLDKAFYGFEPDFFQQNVTRMVDDIVSMIRSSLELWPTLVEIVYFHKDRQPLPMVKVKNNRTRKQAKVSETTPPSPAWKRGTRGRGPLESAASCRRGARGRGPEPAPAIPRRG